MLRNSLAANIIFWVILASITLFIPASTYKYWKTEKALYEDLENNLETTILRLSGTLPQLLWNYNDNDIQKHLDIEVNQFSFKAIAIEIDGQLAYQSSKVLDGPRSDTLNNEQLARLSDITPHSLYYQGEDGSGFVGNLFIIPNEKAVRAELNRFIINLLLEMLLFEFLLCCLIFLIFYSKIINPINNTNDALKDITKSGADLSRRLDEDTSYEMGELAKNYNKVADYVNIKLSELHLALEKSEESTKLKSEFLARMSHEIRTPMNGIIGSLDLLKKETLNSQQNNFVNIAKDSADALLIIINDILDFSKIEAGKLEIEYINFNLHDLLQSCLDNFLLSAKEKNLELSLHCDYPEHPFVIGDPNRIRQILINIISNAIKFTHHGSVSIEARLIKSDQQKCFFQCDIRDTGIGISEDKLCILFDDFSQVDASTTRKYGGTGLGLAICEQLCHLMEGKISVSSQLKQGTCFSIYLPLEEGEKLEENNHEKTTFIQQDYDEEKNILLVEDDLINQEIALANLEILGFNVDIAENGIEAIDKLKSADPEHRYNIILMDCLMPEMDGYETTKAIRKGEADNHQLGQSGIVANIPIVAMTANAMKGDREKCIAAGMDDYLSKPINPEDLNEKLTHWLHL